MGGPFHVVYKLYHFPCRNPRMDELHSHLCLSCLHETRSVMTSRIFLMLAYLSKASFRSFIEVSVLCLSNSPPERILRLALSKTTHNEVPFTPVDQSRWTANSGYVRSYLTQGLFLTLLFGQTSAIPYSKRIRWMRLTSALIPRFFLRCLAMPDAERSRVSLDWVISALKSTG